MPSQLAKTSVAARLDRLPLCGFHRRFISVIALGGWFDLYDLFMMAYIGAALQTSAFMTLDDFTRTIAAGFLGMFLGTVMFGVGSGIFGRRPAFMSMLLWYSGFSLAGAFAPSPMFLMTARFLAGIGVGAELVIIDTYVTEIVPKRSRGRYVSIAYLIGFIAVPAAALVSALLIPRYWLFEGWRWVMVIGSGGALLVWYIRRRLPESPRWLESRGKHDEAEAVMAVTESEVCRRTGASLPDADPDDVDTAPGLSVAELFGSQYRDRTVMLMCFHLLQTVGVYGFANWAPTFLLKEGNSLTDSLQYGFFIALLSPAGPLIAVLTAERFERKWALVLLALGMGVSGLTFAVARTATAIVMVGTLMTILSYWFSAVFHAYQAELFPTRARATGVGFTYCFSRLSAVFSSLIVGALLVRGVLSVFVFIAAAMAGVAFIVGLFGPRTNARALEEISH